MDRRQFVAATAAALGTAACGAIPSGPEGGTVGAGPHRAALPAVGASVSIDGIGLGGFGVVVTRVSASSVVAVSRVCTHASCQVALPSPGSATMFCPCHGSIFTTTGAVLAGPASVPLLSYPAVIDAAAGQVVVTIS
jgi:cytochrome b6-f complex iron-sulfur subunit